MIDFLDAISQNIQLSVRNVLGLVDGLGEACMVGEMGVESWWSRFGKLLQWFDNPRRESTYKENKHPRSPDKIGGSSGGNFQDSSLSYGQREGRGGWTIN